jgi:hypothetical protein
MNSRIKEEVRMIETLHMRIVVVVDGVCVEQFARVIGIVTKFL